MKIETNQKTVKELFGEEGNQEIFYKIPPYQRGYSWRKNKELEEFFNDISENEEGYFLGSIICIYNNEKDDKKELEVIDGQQRLTTISILLSALLNITNNAIEEEIITFKEDEKKVLIAYNLKKLIVVDNKLKLSLSIQNKNNEDYKYLLSTIPKKSTKKLFFLKKVINEKELKEFNKGQINKAYEYFYDRIKEFSIQDIFILLKKVLSTNIVKIEVNDISSAFTLFESVNNRGKPLTPIDLIKNSIIGKREEIKKESPEITNKKWQKLIENIEKYADQVRFLRHYYHAFQCSNSKVKIDGFTKATKSNIMKIYPKHIQKDVEFIFDELIEKSKTYTVFINPENIENSNMFFKYQDKLIDLQRLGIAPAYSLLLYLFVEEEKNDFSDILNFIENWFLRRHITDYPATNKLDQIFLDLINHLCANKKEKKLKDIKELIFEFLLNSDRYKSDEDFQKILVTSKLYDTNQGATRCLLTKLEKSKRTKESGGNNFWETTGTKKPTLVWTIEHIYPQNPRDKRDWTTTCNGEERIEYLHKLGNLTLTRYNSTYSDKSYKDKIAVIDNKGLDIGLKSGNVKINQYLIDNTDNEWCIKHIEERGELLANEIIELMK